MSFLDNFNKEKRKVERATQSPEEEKTTMCREEKRCVRTKVNMWWVICILSISIISLLAFIYTNNTANGTKILLYLEFAGTLLSIVLSIFAILYSYFSALEASRQWGDINTAVRVIENATKHIESNNVTMLATMMSIHGEVNEIKDGTQAQKNKQPENLQMPQNIPSNTPPAQ